MDQSKIAKVILGEIRLAPEDFTARESIELIATPVRKISEGWRMEILSGSPKFQEWMSGPRENFRLVSYLRCDDLHHPKETWLTPSTRIAVLFDGHIDSNWTRGFPKNVGDLGYYIRLCLTNKGSLYLEKHTYCREDDINGEMSLQIVSSMYKKLPEFSLEDADERLLEVFEKMRHIAACALDTLHRTLTDIVEDRQKRLEHARLMQSEIGHVCQPFWIK